MNRTREVLAWVAAIVTFAAINIGISLVGDKVGVPVSFDVDPFTVDYGHGAEGEVSSITTAYGWGVNVLSVLAGVISWHAVHGRRFTRNGAADFSGWLVGSVIMIVGGVPLFLYLKEPAWLGNLAELGLLAASIFAGMKFAENKKGA